ncbi:hypothetical protein [Winogradskyella sp.]|uniref:hypothetical protein n=1 Tax=Winogradskyella sp. TaxID=1883156 RepID=UPI00260FE641|nr:hypothetical protein [Winogradskyella sp.]
MKKFKSKSFVIVFLILLVIQFLIVFMDAKLNTSSSVNEITDKVILIFSFPINLINENLPFYVRESIFIRAIYWLMNLFIQSSVLYLGWLTLKRVLKKMK